MGCTMGGICLCVRNTCLGGSCGSACLKMVSLDGEQVCRRCVYVHMSVVGQLERR